MPASIRGNCCEFKKRDGDSDGKCSALSNATPRGEGKSNRINKNHRCFKVLPVSANQLESRYFFGSTPELSVCGAVTSGDNPDRTICVCAIVQSNGDDIRIVSVVWPSFSDKISNYAD